MAPRDPGAPEGEPLPGGAAGWLSGRNELPSLGGLGGESGIGAGAEAGASVGGEVGGAASAGIGGGVGGVMDVGTGRGGVITRVGGEMEGDGDTRSSDGLTGFAGVRVGGSSTGLGSSGISSPPLVPALCVGTPPAPLGVVLAVGDAVPARDGVDGDGADGGEAVGGEIGPGGMMGSLPLVCAIIAEGGFFTG